MQYFLMGAMAMYVFTFGVTLVLSLDVTRISLFYALLFVANLFVIFEPGQPNVYATGVHMMFMIGVALLNAMLILLLNPMALR